MKIKSGRKMDIKFSSKLENIYLNEGTYNLLIGAIVLYGLLINLITCAFFRRLCSKDSSKSIVNWISDYRNYRDCCIDIL